jgi:hypothetical protein
MSQVTRTIPPPSPFKKFKNLNIKIQWKIFLIPSITNEAKRRTKKKIRQITIRK